MRTFNRVHFSHVMHSQNKCTRLRCAGMKTLPLHAEWRGTIGLSVPRNSTSNWAIATCLTRVFSCHPQPKHTHWSVWSSNFNHCSNQNTWSNIDFFFFYLFQCFSKHPDCVFCCLGVELHQCSITNLNTGPSYSIFFCHRKFRFFYLEDSSEGSYKSILWKPRGQERTGISSTRELPTGAWKHRAQSIKKTKNTQLKKKKRHKKCGLFFSVLFWKQTLVSCEWKRRHFYHTVINTTSSTLCFTI